VDLIFRSTFGSHIYGTNTPESDTDFKGIFLPDHRDIILQKPPRVYQKSTGDDRSRNTAADVDEEIFALHHWFNLFQQGQTVCYDMLFTPRSFWTNHSGWWATIQDNKAKLVNSKITAFAGYCQAQAAKYSLKGSNLAAYRLATDFFERRDGHKRLNDIRDDIHLLIQEAEVQSKYSDKHGEALIKIVTLDTKAAKGTEEYLQVGPKTKVPFTASVKLAHSIFQTQFEKYGARAKMAETNQGVDWKALMHAVRVCEEAKELLLTGNITFPRPEAAYLLKVRKGELDYREVAERIVEGLDDLYYAKTKTSLPEEPDRQWIEDFVYEAYSSNR
jgi:predicted nucleotidyltransferase